MYSTCIAIRVCIQSEYSVDTYVTAEYVHMCNIVCVQLQVLCNND